MSNKLKIITTESNSGKDIYIGGTKEYPHLAYKTDEGDVVIISTPSKSPFTPLHCSELYSILKSRAWNKVDGCRFVLPTQDGGKLFYRVYDSDNAGPLDSPVDIIDKVSLNLIRKSGDVVNSEKMFEIRESNLTDDDINEITIEYQSLFGSMAIKVDEFTIYDSSKKSVNIEEGVETIIDVIKYDSDIYTDTVSLNQYMSISSSPGTYCNADITVQYSKDEEIYTHDSSILAFKYKTNSVIKDNLYEEIGDDVVLEYINGVIKVYPRNNNVEECIITSCTIRYGKQS